MRIISGRYKGKQIQFIKSQTTRPLKDSVKESIFNNSKWLWIIGGGDTLYKPTLKLLNMLKSDKYNEKIIVGSMIIGNRKNKYKQHYPYTKIWQNIDKMRLNHPAMIISTLTYKKIGFYPSWFR